MNSVARFGFANYMDVMIDFRQGLCAALAAASIILMHGTTVRAADESATESAWAEDLRSSIRLIAGSNKASAANLRAGIEIKLQSGWKTYWRYPGDSGVPPRFDFSGSENLAPEPDRVLDRVKALQNHKAPRPSGTADVYEIHPHRDHLSHCSNRWAIA